MPGNTRKPVVPVRWGIVTVLAILAGIQVSISPSGSAQDLSSQFDEAAEPPENGAEATNVSRSEQASSQATARAIEKGRSEMMRRRWSEALKCFTDAILQSPNDPAGYWFRAKVLRQLGRRDEALVDFGHIVQLVDKPATLPALRSRAYALIELGRWDEALQDLNQALTQNADDGESLMHRGRTLEALGRLEEAISDYSKVVKLFPRWPDAWLRRGNALMRMKRFHDALASQKRAIRLGGIGPGELIYDDVETGAVLRFVFVSPGAYSVGYSEQQRATVAGQARQLLFGHNATPLSEVDLRHGFFILDREITEDQWYAFRKRNHESPNPPELFEEEELRLGVQESETPESEQVPDKGPLPVAGVSWVEAISFCEAIQQRLGLAVRLPTEIEWECAGRQQREWLYPWGNNGFHAWAEKDGDNSGPRALDLAVNRDVTPSGIYDMAGNLSEWCLDEYRNVAREDAAEMTVYTPAPFSYSRQPATPTGGRSTRVRQRVNVSDASLRSHFGTIRRSYRGGAYCDNRFNCQLPVRRALNADDRLPSIGFRIVLLLRFVK